MQQLVDFKVAVTLLACFSCAGPGQHPGQPARIPTLANDGERKDYGHIGDEVTKLVREQFMSKKNDVGKEWAARHSGYARGIRSRSEFATLTNTLLSELAASHTHLYVPEDIDYAGIVGVYQKGLNFDKWEYESIGIDVAQTPEGQFIRTVLSGGSAEGAGLLRGDNILTIDGKPFHAATAFRAMAGKTAMLIVKRRADGSTVELPVAPRAVNPRDEWMQAQKASSRLIERSGRKIAYTNIYSCVGEQVFGQFQSDIMMKFPGADALIVDFRNGWGGCSLRLLELFNPNAPWFTDLDGQGNPSKEWQLTWRKPLFLVINGGTRSGKEIVAFALKEHRLATLVGVRTAGAVASGRPFLLSDGSVLYLAMGIALIDGQRLEGHGVEPDVLIEDHLEYAEGKDIQLERALEMAAEKGPN